MEYSFGNNIVLFLWGFKMRTKMCFILVEVRQFDFGKAEFFVLCWGETSQLSLWHEKRSLSFRFSAVVSVVTKC